jgi:hypothetical protein
MFLKASAVQRGGHFECFRGDDNFSFLALGQLAKGMS